MKVIEWNINKRGEISISKPFVRKRILSYDADVICLVEYTDDIDLKKELESMYWLFESCCTYSRNQILIAVKKSFVVEKPIEIKREGEKNCFNLLHIKITLKEGVKVSVIGVRMLTGFGKYRIDAEVQTPPLNEYLNMLNEPFFCIGDFNIYESRMLRWFPDYKKQYIVPSEDLLKKTSYVFSNKMVCIDNILTSSELKAIAEYNWDFVEDDSVYPKTQEMKNGCVWDIKPGLPDHSVLISDISFIDKE